MEKIAGKAESFFFFFAGREENRLFFGQMHVLLCVCRVKSHALTKSIKKIKILLTVTLYFAILLL